MKQLYPPSEEFLQYVWHERYFRYQELKTANGQAIKIDKTGIWNRNQGPDFLDAIIEIDKIKHAGHVEIHLNSQDWYRHNHHLDPAYNSCILHVVFESNEVPILRQDGSFVPELILKPHVDAALWQKYDHLRLSETRIPCEFYLDEVSVEDKGGFLSVLGEARFMEKVSQLRALLKTFRQNWAEVLWHRIAWNLGGKVNREAFLEMAKSFQPSILGTYNRQPQKLEALFFGALGLLSSSLEDSYFQQLQADWKFLKLKHGFQAKPLIPLKFLRMHPASFPTIRISHLAMLLPHFPRMEDLLNPESWEDLLAIEIKASPYWEQHVRFGEQKEKHVVRRLGQLQKENLILNELAPLAYLYLHQHGRKDVWPLIKEKLAGLKPENNRITRKWQAQGFPNSEVLHSQGIVKLAKDYCMQKRCLECEIGQRIVKP